MKVVRDMLNCIMQCVHPIKKENNKIESLGWINTKNFEKRIPTQEKLPISVVLTLSEHRKNFTNSFVLSAIEANNPKEVIIVEDKDLGVQEKRNKGAKMATQEYIFFCDDDIILPANHLKILLNTLIDNPECGYAYTDYQSIIFNSGMKNFYFKSKEFDEESLKVNNYISTMSLVKRDILPEFDINIARLQDWDLWLTMLSNNIKGKYVENTGFLAFYLDDGITTFDKNYFKHRKIVLKKHNLL